MADFPEAAHDLLLIDTLLSDEERATRHAVRAFAVRRAPQPARLRCTAQTLARLNNVMRCGVQKLERQEWIGCAT